MNQLILKKYAEKIPMEVRNIVKGLDDENRLGIIVALLENGKMTFNEMKEKFEINSSSLSNHLSILEEGNLIQNFYEKSDNRLYSYYDVTDIPEAMINSILDIGFRNNIYDITKTQEKADQIPKDKEMVTKPTDYKPIDTSPDFVGQKVEAT